MNLEKKYRRSRLRDLSETVSSNLSLSVSPCLQSASESPLLPRNCFPFISRDPSPSMAQKIRVFNALVLEKETSLRHGKGGEAVEIWLTGSLQRRASTLLRRATPQRGVPRRCVPEAPLHSTALLIAFFALVLYSIIWLPFLFQYRHIL